MIYKPPKGPCAPVEDAFEGKGVRGVPFAPERAAHRRTGLAVEGGPRGEVQQTAVLHRGIPRRFPPPQSAPITACQVPRIRSRQV